jgi:hypothetical protein
LQIDPGVFSQASTNQTRVFLILFCTTLAVESALNFREHRRYFETRPARIYGPPPRLLGRFQLPSLKLQWFQGFGIVFIGSLIFASLGILPRLFLLIALFSYFPYFNSIMSLASIQRKTNLLPIVLLVLAAAPSLNASFQAPSPLWPIFLIQLAVVQMYFSAGVQKLRSGGLNWCDGESLRAYLIKHYLWGDTKSALKLAGHPTVCKLLSIFLLVFELTFWLILFFPRLTYFYVAAGIGFHLGTAVTMRINYLRYIGPVYAVFFIDTAIQVKKFLGL